MQKKQKFKGVLWCYDMYQEFIFKSYIFHFAGYSSRRLGWSFVEKGCTALRIIMNVQKIQIKKKYDLDS